MGKAKQGREITADKATKATAKAVKAAGKIVFLFAY